MKSLFEKFNKPIVVMILVCIVLSSIFGRSVLSYLVFMNSAYADSGMVIGQSGTLSPGDYRTSIAGIMDLDQPAIRISLYRNDKAKLNPTNGLSTIYNKMYNGQPEDLTGSLYFISSIANSHINGRPVSLAYYNASNKSLTYTGTQNNIDNIITEYSSGTISVGFIKTNKGIYFQSASSNLDSLKANWKTYASQSSYIYSSKMAWSYILTPDSNGKYHVDERINELFNPDKFDYNNISKLSSDDQLKAKYHYLDMIMSLYTVASGDTKKIWEKAVSDYITGDNLDVSTISVCFDTAAIMTFGSYIIIVPTLDYANYAAGVDSKWTVNGKSWWSLVNLNRSSGSTGEIEDSLVSKKATAGDSYRQIIVSIDNSIFDSPRLKRITDSFNSKNGFSFGITALFDGRLSTKNGYGEFTSPDAVTSDYFNIFELNSLDHTTVHEYGYMLSSAPNITLSNAYGKLVATPDNEIVKGDTLGKVVTLQLWGGCSDSDKNTWYNLTNSTSNYFVVTTTYTRTSSEFGTAMNMQTNPNIQYLSPSEFYKFITGSKSLDVTYDDVSSYDIRNYKGTTVKFNYTANVNIKLLNSNGSADKTWDLVSYNGTSKNITDDASFIILAKKIGYASTPEAYSELKNYGKGSNESGTLKESYEAMAGVPSTEQLYFAAGGSEFIVDVTLEQVKNEVAKRTYVSYFTGTDCEFKQGDTAPNQMLGGYSVDLHNGSTYTKTWTGSIPNKASAVTVNGSGDVTATCPAQPDRTAYDKALSEANAYVTKVNSTTLSFTSASDKLTRSSNNWNASITTNNPVDPQDTSASNSAWHTESSTDSKGNTTSWQVPDPCSATANPGAAGNYTITVTFIVPTHVIDGPCSEQWLPDVYDTWAQTWQYDSMKITDVHVWTIDQASVNGMSEITSEDVVGADIKSGRPTIFYNIALKNDSKFTQQVYSAGGATNTSKVGRVRYSYLPEQNDVVTINNGVRSNKCDGMAKTYSTNVNQAGGNGHSETYATGFKYNAFALTSTTSGASQSFVGQKNYPTNTVNYLQDHTDDKDKQTIEYKTFLSQRQQQVTATMITDFLILQTSSGDQAVLYYDSTNDKKTATSESQLPTLTVSKETMWDNNSNSAAKWSADEINVGSYNGDYSEPAKKFTGTGKNQKIATVFDNDVAKVITRTARPTKPLMLYQGELNIIAGDSNKAYITGNAEVFWANSLNWTDTSTSQFSSATSPWTATALFSTSTSVGTRTGYNFLSHATFSPEGPSTGGFVLDAPYSDRHSKINDIIVHDPVSTEYTNLISLDDSMDQRTGVTSGTADNIKDIINGDNSNYAYKKLNCTFFDDTVLFKSGFDTLDASGNPINEVNGASIDLSKTSGFTVYSDDAVGYGNALSAKGTRMSIPFSDLMDLEYHHATHIKAEADVLISQSTSDTMLFSFSQYALYIPKNQTYAILETTNSQSQKQVSIPLANGKKHHIAVDFSFNSIGSCHVYIDGTEANLNSLQDNTASGDLNYYLNATYVGSSFNVGSWGYDNNYPANYYIDNLKITRLAGVDHHTDDCYQEVITHPNGFDVHIKSASDLNGKLEDVSTTVKTPGGNGSKVLNYTGSRQEFEAPYTGTYTIELYGAQGGSDNNAGGLGGYSNGNVSLTKGQKIYIFVGGKGGDAKATVYDGGYNGGGYGYGYGGGGGGMTFVSTSASATAAPSNQADSGGTWNDSGVVIVAGGGGGAGPQAGGAGGGTTGDNGTSGCGTAGSCGTQTSGGAAGRGNATAGGHGYGGSNTEGPGSGGGGGGAGWYGGGAGGNDYSSYNDNDDSGGGGGSGYIGGVTYGTTSSGIRAGDGLAIISWNIAETTTTTTVKKYTSGAEWLVQEYEAGNITDDQLQDILGSAYDSIMANSCGDLLYTWKDWTTSNMLGFRSDSSSTLSVYNNQLSLTASNSTSQLIVPVNFDASAVMKVKVYLDNNTSSTVSKMFWSNSSSGTFSDTASVSRTVSANTAGQTVQFVVKGKSSWTGTISYLRFDLGNVSGNYRVSKIEVYGSGNVAASDSSTQIVYSSGTAGYSSYNLSPGTYKLETWGAQGGTVNGIAGGMGGYSSGNISVTQATALGIYVGGQGICVTSGFATGGYNGGGSAYAGDWAATSSGGGASDIRINGTGYNNRVIVAGGGGGTTNGNGGIVAGGYGGGVYGGGSYAPGYTASSGGTQSSAGTSGNTNSQTAYQAGFGFGGYCTYSVGSTWYGAGGGGGWYGGGYGGTHGGGSGGSGYVLTESSYKPSGYALGSQYYLSDTSMIAGNASMPSPNGGLQLGQAGNGYVRITAQFTAVKITAKSGDTEYNEGQVLNYSYSGSIQTVTLLPGTYRVEAWGAQGGNAYGHQGGKGAYAVSYITITESTDYKILVGQQGGSGNMNGSWSGSGGGGGTFITTSSNIPIAVAGAGGGSAGYEDGYPGLSTQLSGSTNNGVGYGGSGGQSGNGGGFYGNGSAATSSWGAGGNSFISGGAAQTSNMSTGNPFGGFGGGGSSHGNSGGGAGGGGYTGGKGCAQDNYAGWGGGSYFIGVNGSALAGTATMKSPSGSTEVGHSGNGYAKITSLTAVKESTLDVDDIKEHWQEIPDYLPDGTFNPIWNIDPSDPNYYNSYSAENYALEKVLVCDEPHHVGSHYDADSDICWDTIYGKKVYPDTIKTADGSFTPGNFINIDNKFTVYFPNEGNFSDGQPYGLGSLTSLKGLGYTDDMNTGTWTKVKRIKFDFNVIYDNTLYLAGEWVTLGNKGSYQGSDGSAYLEQNWSNYGTDEYNGIYKNYYDFYCVLANSEAKSATATVDVEAINSNGSNDNTVEASNAPRGKYGALHGGYRDFYVDVVGRIGNLTIEDSGDYRFSNLFKKAMKDNSGNVSSWTVDGVVPATDESKQNVYLTWSKDIRGLPISNSTNYINTYGSLPWIKDSTQENGPLSADKNNIDVLKDEPLRVGYPVYFDVSTVGNYFKDGQSELQVTPYYYALNVDTQEITPVDAYFKYNNSYKAVNVYDLVGENWDGTGIYNYKINLDWESEKDRRNYSDVEKYITEGFENGTGVGVIYKYYNDLNNGLTANLDVPSGHSYILGNAQFLCVDGHARTFIGGETTYGHLKNLGGSNTVSTDSNDRMYNSEGRIENYLWWQEAQRWHLTESLPSSTIFVKHKDIEYNSQGDVIDRQLSADEISQYSSSNYVILCTVNIVAVGDTYALKYDQIGDNGKITVPTSSGNRVSILLPDNIPPVIAVYSSDKSSTSDIGIVGTH